MRRLMWCARRVRRTPEYEHLHESWNSTPTHANDMKTNRGFASIEAIALLSLLTILYVLVTKDGIPDRGPLPYPIQTGAGQLCSICYADWTTGHNCMRH